MKKEEAINCVKCRHFYVTWDKNFPNGCKLFGFKSAKLPDISVRDATGSCCTNFEEKPRRQT